ncbi:hypothetical protein B0I37DRAFT_93973 [Chaetomium sp. MPI-CAGE-AT-0009]|nr:hypothetical protein B0I37DRAFT_93973 [Chaetomium sp. MPI-CAGE-AT-0009]
MKWLSRESAIDQTLDRNASGSEWQIEAAEDGTGFRQVTACALMCGLRGQTRSRHRAFSSLLAWNRHLLRDYCTVRVRQISCLHDPSPLIECTVQVTVFARQRFIPSQGPLPRSAGRSSAAFEHSSTRTPLEDCGGPFAGWGLLCIADRYDRYLPEPRATRHGQLEPCPLSVVISPRKPSSERAAVRGPCPRYNRGCSRVLHGRNISGCS